MTWRPRSRSWRSVPTAPRRVPPSSPQAGEITLTGGTTAYAGLNPKTTTEDGGKELEHIIVSAADDDPNPVSLPVGTITVDKPVVTNWHTAPSDAVPVS